MQVVFLGYHGDKLIAQYKRDDKPRNGEHHVFRKRLNDRKHAGVPLLGRFAYFCRNRAYLFVDVVKHGAETPLDKGN